MYPLNIKKSPVDERDYIVESIHAQDSEPLPLEVDLRNQCQPIRNQGDLPTCAGHTAACMKEWQEHQDVKFNEYMSPQFVYNNRDNQDGNGMYSRDVMKILNKIGIVPESEYPYSSTTPITKELKSKAFKYVIKGYASVNTIDSLKRSLIQNGPCYIAVPVYNYSSRMWKPLPGDKKMGGHAMAVVGYTKEGFIIRNSWGVGWGDKGYTIFPYEDWGLHWEVWSTIDESTDRPLKKKKLSWFRRFLNKLRKIFFPPVQPFLLP